jgi:hypothetical protein
MSKKKTFLSSKIVNLMHCKNGLISSLQVLKVVVDEGTTFRKLPGCV